MPTMPLSTQRAHFEPAWKGDRLAAIRAVGRRPAGRDGIRAIDCNLQVSLDGVAFLKHWSRPEQDDFEFIVRRGGKRVRRMTRFERRRPISRWRAAGVDRWRRSKHIDSERCVRYAEAARVAVQHGVRVTGEAKSLRFRRHDVAARVVAEANAADHPPWFMALYGSMPGCGAKCAAIIGAGGEFAVIFGTQQNLRKSFSHARLAWPVQPTRVW